MFVTKFAYNNNWYNVIKTSSFTILYWNENVSKWKDQIQKNFEKKNVNDTIQNLKDHDFEKLIIQTFEKSEKEWN